MGKLDVSKFGEEYKAEKQPRSYPDLLSGRESLEPTTALTAEAKIRAWHSSFEYQNFLGRTAEMRRAAEKAQKQADLKEIEQILARARQRQASEATAVTDVAELADDQRGQIGRAVTGTV